MEVVTIFDDQENIDIFRELNKTARQAIDSYPRDNDEAVMLNLIGVAAFNMYQYPAMFAKYCTFNNEHIGEKLISEARSISLSSVEDIQHLFVLCYRYLIELQICYPDGVNSEVLKAVHSVVVGDMGLSPLNMAGLHYAEHQMVVGIISKYIHSKELAALKDLPQILASAKLEKAQFTESLDAREQRVEALKSSLDKYEQSFNFVGLSDGFKKIRSQKIWQKRRGQLLLTALSLMMLSPFGIKFYMFFAPSFKVVGDYEFYIALLGFELLLMYFFRVALQGFKAIRAQLLQIDLRLALCQFIQSYADYAKGVKEKDADLLVRFEQIVFSGIIINENDLPSTFDGLEQIAKLITALKKP